MSGPQTGFLANYNSLKDKHLVGYFRNPRIRQHLQRSGLISRSGRIIPEKEYQLNIMRRNQERHVQECLARTIFHKMLDMEYHHQLEIRKLEDSERKKKVQKIKVEHSRKPVENGRTVCFPHPPLGPRNHCHLHPLVAGDPAGHSQLRIAGPIGRYNSGHPSHHYHSREPGSSDTISWRPNTAPGNMRHPLRLQPLRPCAVVGSVPKPSSSKQKCHALERGRWFATGGERSGLRLLTSVEYVTRSSPCHLPDVTPVPPPPQQKGDKSLTAARTGMPRGRRFHPTTAPNHVEQPLVKNSGGFPKPSSRSNAFVTMVFLGKSLHLSHHDTDYRDEIKVYQQHCGGENLCVYKGKLLEGETFQFLSRRHHGFPFSLTFFLNGIQVHRLSCCCEYKHQKRSRLGGRHGYFMFLNVEGASPCYRCIIAMSLDKKPPPPKRKMEEDHEEKHVGPWGDEVCSEPQKSSVEQKASKSSVLVIVPGHEANVKTIEDKMETEQEYRKEEKKKLSVHESEDSQEDTSKNEYEEDFEADEEANEEGQTGDQMNGMSESSSDNKKHNLDYEKENETSSQKALQASDSEKDESDGCSDSDSEDDKQAGRPAHLLSSSTQGSSDDDSSTEEMSNDTEDKGEWNIKGASDNTAHAQDGNENEENKLLRVEENQETLVLEKEGIDEAEKAKPEDLTAWEDTGDFDGNIMATQHQSPEVNGQLEQAGSGSAVEEDGEKNPTTRRNDGEESPLVPLESSMMEVEGGSEESPLSKEEGAPDGAFLAEGRRTLDMQKAAEQVVQEGQMVGERQALEKEDFVAEGGGTHTEEAGGEIVLAKEAMVAVLQVEAQPVVWEAAPSDSTMAEEDPRGKGTRKGAVAPWEQEFLREVMESEAAVGEKAPGEEELPGPLLGRAEYRAVPKEEVAEEVAKGEEAVEVTGPLVKEMADEMVSEEEEAVEERGSAGKDDDDVGALSEEEEAVEERGSAGKDDVAGALSEEEEAVEERGSAGKDDVAGALSEEEEAVEERGSAGKDDVAGALSEEEEAVEERGSAGKDDVAGALSEEEEAVERGSAGKDDDDVGALSEEEEAVERGSAGKDDVAGALSEEEEAVEERGSAGKDDDVVGALSEEEEAVERGSVGKDDVAGTLSEEEEAVEDVSLAEAGIARVVTPEGEESVEEAVSEGDEAVQKPGALLETSGDTNVCTGDAMTGGEDLVKLTEFSQLKISGEEQMEMERAAIGAATSEADQASEVEGSSPLRAEDTVEESVEPAKSPMLQVAPGLEALVDAGRDPINEGSSQLEETSTAGEEGLAEALLSRNPSLGSKAMTESTMEEKSDGDVTEVAADIARAESGGGWEVMDGAAGLRQLAAGMEGLLKCAAERGKERAPVEGAGAGAWLLAPGLCVGEGSVVAVAVVGGQAAPRALAGELGQEEEMAGDGRVGGGTVVHEGVTGAGESGLGTENPVSTPVCEAGEAEPRGRGSAGGEGLGPGTWPQTAASGTGSMGRKDEPQERTEEVGGKSEVEQPGTCENMGEREVVGVLENAQRALGDMEQSGDSPVRGSPSALGAADRKRSFGVYEDAVHPDAVAVLSVQTQDGEETRF